MAFLKYIISNTVHFRDKVSIEHYRDPYAIYRMVPLSMTVSDLWHRFQGHTIFEVEYRKNGVS